MECNRGIACTDLERSARKADHEREQSFFALGGHSLLATQVVARLRPLLKVEIKVQAIFEAPTIAALALRVEQELHEEQGMQSPPLERQERGSQSLPLSFAQQRLCFWSNWSQETRRT